MKHVNRDDFNARYRQRPAAQVYEGCYRSDLHITEDAVISGAVASSATVYVHSHTQVSITGRIDGHVRVARHAVLWNDGGLLDGEIYVEGAAYLLGSESSVKGSADSVVFDPTEPPDA